MEDSFKQCIHSEVNIISCMCEVIISCVSDLSPPVTMGIDSNRFEGTVDEELICPICSSVLEDPVQVRLSHVTRHDNRGRNNRL